MKTINFAALAAVAAFIAGPASAQTADDNQPDMVTPPRLAVAEGNVQFWRPGEDAWERAQLNAALAKGDAISAGDDATVELQIGPRDFARLRAGTLLTLVDHDPGLMHFQLASGTASFDLRGGRAGQLVRIDADTANIVVGGHGYYRIETREGETRLAVRNRGQATLTFADGRSRSIGAGEEIVVYGDGGVDVHAASAPDSWDRWNDARSDYYAAAASNRYVPDDVYGAADLDQHGSWREDRTYGWIWMPAVAVGWAPYSTGNWRWDPFYGWTWIDVAPWGWTTSHYGRWVHVGGAWCWAPGPRRARFVYAPALVAFYQIEGGMSWVALGWGEPLVPWWGRPGFRGTAWYAGWGGPRVVVNVERHVHVNRHVHNGVIVVRDSEFGRHHVRGSSLPVAKFSQPRLVRGDHPIRIDPNRERRRDAMPPRPRLEPAQRQEQPREISPRMQERREPTMRQDERREPRETQRFGQRERPRFESRTQERGSAPEPRSAAPAPAAPVVIQPRVSAPPEMRREAPVQREVQRETPREMQRERRHEERVIQREQQRSQPRPMEVPRTEMRRVEPPRVEMPRPQVQSPSAPEMQRRGPEREQGGHRDRGGRARGPGERD